jgi:hypothetical protein
MTSEDSEKALATAILRNKSNCVWVYNYSEDKSWYSKSISSLLYDGNCQNSGIEYEVERQEKIAREGLVTVAALGVISDPSQVHERLLEASIGTGLSTVDLALIECPAGIGSHLEQSAAVFDAALEQLEELVSGGALRAYGIQIDRLPPYCYHTPAPSVSNARLMLLPSQLEMAIEHSLPNADLVIYK